MPVSIVSRPAPPDVTIDVSPLFLLPFLLLDSTTCYRVSKDLHTTMYCRSEGSTYRIAETFLEPP